MRAENTERNITQHVLICSGGGGRAGGGGGEDGGGCSDSHLQVLMVLVDGSLAHGPRKLPRRKEQPSATEPVFKRREGQFT